jgi:hypothetical protein
MHKKGDKKMNFMVNFNMDNATFEETPEIEIRDHLVKIANMVMGGRVFGTIMDTNGNKIGDWEITDD